MSAPTLSTGPDLAQTARRNGTNRRPKATDPLPPPPQPQPSAPLFGTTDVGPPALLRNNSGIIVKVRTAAAHGVDAMPIEIEVDSSRGQAGIRIVGLPDKAVNEAQERVRAAMENSGYDFPVTKITINLAPGDIRKEGPSFDLPIAVGLLAVSHQIDPNAVGRFAMLGELALDGRVRGVTGVLPIVMELKRRRYQAVIVPEDNAAEAGVVDGISVYAVSHLKEVVGLLNSTYIIEPFKTDVEAYFARLRDPHPLDFSEVIGQEAVKRAVVVAAAGGHNMLMLGNPGVGKSMIAKRIPGVLPDLTIPEALTTTKVYSAAGKLSRENPIITRRPFRSPHHTVSDAGLVGGGMNPRPGEISLAHNGVLFLDELPEFNRKTLEVMRQPLEDGHVTITRAQASYTFPARIMLIAAMNPCPCGYLGHPHRKCLDTPRQIIAYRNRVSGPLLDRIDVHLEVPTVDVQKFSRAGRSLGTAEMAAQARAARDIQTRRFKGTPVTCNAHMTDRMVQELVKLDGPSSTLLDQAMKQLAMSPRAYARIKKLARTLADLAASENISIEHVSEAIGYRALDRMAG